MRKVSNRAAWVAAVAVGLFAAAPASSAPSVIYDLGTLGATAINDSGQVTGGDAAGHVFLYTGIPGSGGAMADLGILGAGFAINASGQIAGCTSTTGDTATHAFLYTGVPGSGGAIVDLGTLGGDCWAASINASGQVVGGSNTATGKHAFLYTGVPGSGGAMVDLGITGGAAGINANGQVAGYYNNYQVSTFSHAFLYTGVPGSGGAMADLGTLGGTGSLGLAINDSGQVTGSSNTTGDETHAFLYTGVPGSGGAMADLGTLGGTYSEGDAINASGEVVGYSKTTGDLAQHAFLYRGTPGIDGQMIDLDLWLDAVDPTDGAQWTLYEATGINGTDFVTGWGRYNGGLAVRSFLLDASGAYYIPPMPLIPEASSLGLIIAGGLSLLRRRRP